MFKEYRVIGEVVTYDGRKGEIDITFRPFRYSEKSLKKAINRQFRIQVKELSIKEINLL